MVRIKTSKPDSNEQPITNNSRSETMNGGFKWWEITLARPLEAIAKISFAVTMTPFAVAIIWAQVDNNSFASVTGIALRRGGGAFISETAPIGQTLLNGSTGKGLRPGTPAPNDALNRSIRPGEMAGNPSPNSGQ